MPTKTPPKKPAPRRAAVPPPGTESLMSLDQIAAALGVCKRKVEKMVAAKEYPAHDTFIGDLRRWRVATHNAWVAARCEKRG